MESPKPVIEDKIIVTGNVAIATIIIVIMDELIYTVESKQFVILDEEVSFLFFIK
jgi:hypothetical protein